MSGILVPDPSTPRPIYIYIYIYIYVYTFSHLRAGVWDASLAQLETRVDNGLLRGGQVLATLPHVEREAKSLQCKSPKLTIQST